MLGDDWCVEEVSQAIITWVKSNVDFADPILRYTVLISVRFSNVFVISLLFFYFDSIGCGNAYLLFQLVRAIDIYLLDLICLILCKL